MTPENKMNTFIETVEEETYGKVPEPLSKEMDPINTCIGNFVYIEKQKVVLDGTGPDGLSDEELRYCWRVAKVLGFRPKWDE
jgi:hypothetical protein